MPFRFAAAVACVLMCAAISVGAQDDDTLSAMDYVEIQQLVNRLNFALDYCGEQGREFADSFVDEGRFIIDQGDGGRHLFPSETGDPELEWLLR